APPACRAARRRARRAALAERRRRGWAPSSAGPSPRRAYVPRQLDGCLATGVDDDAIDLGAEQQDDATEEEPEHEQDQAADRAIHDVVVREVTDVDAQPERHREPEHREGDRARRWEAQRLPAGRGDEVHEIDGDQHEEHRSHCRQLPQGPRAAPIFALSMTRSVATMTNTARIVVRSTAISRRFHHARWSRVRQTTFSIDIRVPMPVEPAHSAVTAPSEINPR